MNSGEWWLTGIFFFTFSHCLIYLDFIAPKLLSWQYRYFPITLNTLTIKLYKQQVWCWTHFTKKAATEDLHSMSHLVRCLTGEHICCMTWFYLDHPIHSATPSKSCPDRDTPDKWRQGTSFRIEGPLQLGVKRRPDLYRQNRLTCCSMDLDRLM